MKRSRLIAFLLTAMMLLSTAATGVFATDEIGIPEPAGESNGEIVLDTPSVPADNSGTEDEEVTPAPVADEENITDEAKQEADSVTATPSGKTVTVSWTDAEVFKIVVKQGDTEVPSEPLTDAEKAEMKKVFTLEYDTEYTFEAFKGTEEAPESVGTATAKTEVKPAPAAPTLYAYPAYHSVYLTWTPSENATKYVLYRTDGAVFDNIGTATSFTDTNNAADTTYSYYVVAFNGDKASANSNVASAARVRTCYYRITFKKNVKLTSHDGTKTKHTFTKGQVVYADGFSQGKYQFDYEGHRYHAKWMRIKKPSGDYATNAYENGVTPTLYVNQTGYGSPTGYLIWISLYSQRVYVFQGSAWNWTLVQDWQCGSGKAKTPTPTGMNKSLHKKMKKYSKHKWWNCFSGNNAIHGSNGQKEIRKLGRLISNGCVRVTNDQAIWIFNTVPKGTRVLVF